MDRASFARQIVRGFDEPDDRVTGDIAPGGISPVHALTLESEHPEYRYLRQERCAAGHQVDPADAANFSHVLLANPANSGAIIVLENLLVQNLTAGALSYQIRYGSPAAFDTSNPGLILDNRWGPTATVRATGQTGLRTVAAAIGSLIRFIQVPANSQILLEFPMVLAPTAFVAIAGSAINVQAAGSFVWWERAAEDGELGGTGI